MGRASRCNLGDLHCKCRGGRSCLLSCAHHNPKEQEEKHDESNRSEAVNNHVRAHTSACPDSADSGRCVRCAAAQRAGMLGQQYSLHIIKCASGARVAKRLICVLSVAAVCERLTAVAKNSHPRTCGELQPPLGIRPTLTQPRHAADTQPPFNHLSCSDHSPTPHPPGQQTDS